MLVPQERAQPVEQRLEHLAAIVVVEYKDGVVEYEVQPIVERRVMVEVDEVRRDECRKGSEVAADAVTLLLGAGQLDLSLVSLPAYRGAVGL